MSIGDRRRATRVPVGLYVNQLVGNEQHRCFTTSLSTTGVYLERLVGPWARQTNEVQLELALPGLADPLWVCGEVVYDSFDALFHCTAVQFTRMARAHGDMLASWLERAGSALSDGPAHVIRTPIGVEIVRPTR